MIVLIVDDDKVLINVYQANLELDGHEVIMATGGEMALDQISIKKPDLIISDIRMPEGDGIELLKSLKANPRTSMIPIIITTGYYRDLSEEEIIKLGAMSVLRKPVNFVKIEAVLQSLH